MHAYFLDACNCNWGCPCQFNVKSTHGNCEGVSGYHIISGYYGTGIKLDGLNMALIASWPGPIHGGHAFIFGVNGQVMACFFKRDFWHFRCGSRK